LEQRADHMKILEVEKWKNSKESFNGMDHIDRCNNKDHFLNYNKNISYEYNSKGFRDEEWPANLQNKIWCIGDSFTVGIGQPHDETWPKLLEKSVREKCINIGEDGCSNDLMSLRAKYIIEKYQPKTVIIMWSYFWRRFVDGKNIHFEHNKKELPKDDVDNFLKNFHAVNNLRHDVINFVIPDCFIESDLVTKNKFLKKNKKNINKILKYVDANISKKLIEVEQTDYARDGHHFGLSTTQKIVTQVVKYIE